MKTSRCDLICAAAFCGFVFSTDAGHAQDSILPGFLAPGGFLDNPDPDLVFSVGAGASFRPTYFGSDDYELGATGSFRFDFVRFPNGFSLTAANAVGFNDGFSLLGSANYVAKRNSSDHAEIRGLDDVDRTLELGFGIGYEQENYRLFADARYGFFGHKAFVGDLGADWISRPIEGLTLTIGPRLSFGDSKYADTYFGVSQSASAASGLQDFSADGGLLGAGLEMTAFYQFDPRWGVRAEVTWDRLTGDAGNSPITRQGSDDQYRISLQLVRRISIDF